MFYVSVSSVSREFLWTRVAPGEVREKVRHMWSCGCVQAAHCLVHAAAAVLVGGSFHNNVKFYGSVRPASWHYITAAFKLPHFSVLPVRLTVLQTRKHHPACSSPRLPCTGKLAVPSQYLTAAPDTSLPLFNTPPRNTICLSRHVRHARGNLLSRHSTFLTAAQV